jgi:uncharacterized protein (UPF0548 family)
VTAVFYLRPPSASHIDAILDQRGALPFTYDAVGATGEPLESMPGFIIDRYSAHLGRGSAAFERACTAVRAFAMYPPAWTRVHRRSDDVRAGVVFATVIRHLGFYSVLPCRMVYAIDTRDQTAHCHGFALGTLPGHAESGEERFSVTWNRATDAVTYEVLAFSRPSHLLARAGAPVTRWLQKRFARDSRASMQRATRA